MVVGHGPRAPGEQVGELNTAIAPWRTGLQVLRVVLWCLAGYYWEFLGQRWLRLTPDQLRQWMRLRHTVVGGCSSSRTDGAQSAAGRGIGNRAMGVASYFEFVTTLFGWILYQGIWAVLVDTGIVFIPSLPWCSAMFWSSHKGRG